MKRRRNIKTLDQETENMKVLKSFFEKSGAMVNAAIKESHRKYPDLFKNS